MCLTDTYHLFQIFLTQNWTKTLPLDLYLSQNVLCLLEVIKDKIYNNLFWKLTEVIFCKNVIKKEMCEVQP